MDKNEAIAEYAKKMFNQNGASMTVDEFHDLVNNADSRQEQDFYACVYNYFLKINSQDVISRGIF